MQFLTAEIPIVSNWQGDHFKPTTGSQFITALSIPPSTLQCNQPLLVLPFQKDSIPVSLGLGDYSMIGKEPQRTVPTW